MSETPKFEVIDRRRKKVAEEASEQKPVQATAPAASVDETKPSPGPRLVVSEPKENSEAPSAEEAQMPAAPSAAENEQMKAAFVAASQRLEELVRAQNPGAGAPPPVTFESLVQQFYVSAMIQMGAGTQDGQRPRVDILGARVTIDLLGILAEKTKGSLNEAEERMLHTVLYDVRAAFLELTSMISMQPVPPPPAPAI